tara:strand:+ start:783 stop:983 length:201 start_codon:yes stop_codon:yes gene_type:complete
MKLEKRKNELLKCKTVKDYEDLYEKVFKEEVPETQTRDPDELLINVANAIFDNKELKEVPLNGADI